MFFETRHNIIPAVPIYSRHLPAGRLGKLLFVVLSDNIGIHVPDPG
jgi:hypothetical protein